MYAISLQYVRVDFPNVLLVPATARVDGLLLSVHFCSPCRVASRPSVLAQSPTSSSSLLSRDSRVLLELLALADRVQSDIARATHEELECSRKLVHSSFAPLIR